MMSWAFQRAIRWLTTLGLIISCFGCSDTSVPDSDTVIEEIADPDVTPTDGGDSPPIDAADVLLDAPTVDVTLDGVSSAEDVPAISDHDTGPVVAIPEGKANWSCSADSHCNGCAGQGACLAGECYYGDVQCVIRDGEGPWASCVSDGTVLSGSTCLHCDPLNSPNKWTGDWAWSTFEEGLGALGLTENLGDPGVHWWTSTTRAQDGSLFSATFGNESTGTYEGTGRAFGRVSTRVFPNTHGVSGRLRFWLWLETEEMPGFDILRVLLTTPETEYELWTSESIEGTTHGGWELVVLQVEGPPGVPTAVTLEFDSVDDVMNGYEGVFVDQFALTTGCCSADSDCYSDGCTIGTCAEDGRCAFEWIDGCCNVPADCYPDVCMAPTCSGPQGECGEEPIADCCLTPADCDDDDPCTGELCAYYGGQCEHIVLCCSEDIDCVSPDQCLRSRCDNDECVYTDVCCEEASDCEYDPACATAACVQELCLVTALPIAGCCTEQIYVETFDSNTGLSGWSFQGATGGVQWGVETPALDGQPSSPGGLYYGDPTTWSYNSGGTNGGMAKTPYLTVPVGVEVTLDFQLYIDIQASPATDIFQLRLNGPGGWSTILTKQQLVLNQWNEVSFDVSALAGKTMQLGFDFQSQTPWNNDGFGILVDDLRITTTCVPRPCESVDDCTSIDWCLESACTDGACTYTQECCQTYTDCDDHNVCTVDECADLHCKNTLQSGCCATAADCGDEDICTLDVCTGYGGTCFNVATDGCCHDAGECDDDDACTVDLCLDNVCDHIDVCCVTDADCDDDDDVCTIDECDAGFCTHAPTGLAGCCLSMPAFWDFETVPDFTFSSTSPPCAWQVANVGASSSGTQVLYYGDSSVMNFNCGANAGTATSPEIVLMAGFEYTLSFEANLDVESNTTFDTLELYALVGDQQILLWDKTMMVTNDAWFGYVIDLTAFAGQTLRLYLDFNTYDDLSNESTGIYVDDIRITSTCMPKPCLDDFGCSDGLPDTSDWCELTGCGYSIP